MVTFAALYIGYLDKRAKPTQDIKSTCSEGEFCYACLRIHMGIFSTQPFQSIFFRMIAACAITSKGIFFDATKAKG